MRDPLSERLARIADENGPFADRLAPALLAIEGVFGKDLPANPLFTQAVTEKLGRLFAAGARQAVAEILAV
ncbi:hypothetical protein D3C83_276450 [compost metagenome]